MVHIKQLYFHKKLCKIVFLAFGIFQWIYAWSSNIPCPRLQHKQVDRDWVRVRDKKKQTDRRRDRQTDRQAGRQAGRQTEINNVFNHDERGIIGAMLRAKTD